jgi:hypothetical protein
MCRANGWNLSDLTRQHRAISRASHFEPLKKSREMR